MSQPEKAAELIYVPEASWTPVLTAAGFTALVAGLYAWWPIALLGAVILLLSVKNWFSANRADIARMPREQHTETAPVPLSAIAARND